MNKKGDMSGIPVEHDKDFDSYPELGYDPDNRNLGSTLVNSIVRNESDLSKRRELLVTHLYEKINNIEKLTGKSFRDLTEEMEYLPQRKLVQRMAGDPAVQDFMQEITAQRDAQAAGAIVGEKPVVVNAGEGSKVYLRTNGNGHNGNGTVKHMFNNGK